MADCIASNKPVKRVLYKSGKRGISFLQAEWENSDNRLGYNTDDNVKTVSSNTSDTVTEDNANTSDTLAEDNAITSDTLAEDNAITSDTLTEDNAITSDTLAEDNANNRGTGTCSVCDAVPHKPQEVSHISPSTAMIFNSNTIPSHTTKVAAQIKVLQQAISDLRKDVRKLNSCQRRIQHCHLYVSSNHSLTTTNTITARVALESMLGCPIHEAQSLREGPRKSFKVKINKDHLLVALSSSQGKNHRVRLWKPRSVLSTSPTTTSPTHESAMQTRKLNISSWNARGLKNSVPYMQVLSNTSDIILIQEHWLWPFELHSLSSILSGFTAHGLCDRRLNETFELLRGCGGIAILWKKSIAAHPIHLNIDNDRICGIELLLENHIIKKLLVFNIYFPSTDTVHSHSVFWTWRLSLTCTVMWGQLHAVIAGDFNTHLGTLAGPRGTGSPNQRGLLVKEFVDRNNLFISSHAQVSSGPSFTYHSGDRFSTVDYVIINRTAI